MRTLLFTLMSLACAAVLAATTVYRWVDENGVVHFSDQPHANAEKVHIAAPQTFRALPAGAGGGAPARDREASVPQAAYQSCTIAQPSDGQNFANIPSLGISVRTDPGLHPGDQVFIMLDGGLVNGGAATGTQFTLSPVERGTHSLQALIRDASGGLACQTPTITFSVHQASLANPNNPNRPR